MKKSTSAVRASSAVRKWVLYFTSPRKYSVSTASCSAVQIRIYLNHANPFLRRNIHSIHNTNTNTA